jgi:hypothetical protein
MVDVPGYGLMARQTMEAHGVISTPGFFTCGETAILIAWTGLIEVALGPLFSWVFAILAIRR